MNEFPLFEYSRSDSKGQFAHLLSFVNRLLIDVEKKGNGPDFPLSAAGRGFDLTAALKTLKIVSFCRIGRGRAGKGEKYPDFVRKGQDRRDDLTESGKLYRDFPPGLQNDPGADERGFVDSRKDRECTGREDCNVRTKEDAPDRNGPRIRVSL